MAAISRRWFGAIGAAITLSFWAHPGMAKDPFRTQNPKAIGQTTEAAFNALFKDGNYPEAEKLVQQAVTQEGHEPLVYALQAALAYIDEDANTFKVAASKTREKAEQLVASDPLRGNLYIAVGNFLEGAAIVKEQGIVRGAPAALGKLQTVFRNLDAAEKVDAQDPELNLIKGSMDLMLAVNINLPLSNSDKALARLETAAPDYIADRSLAWGYRDLNQQDKAMAAVDQALKSAPNNPELAYLKAQILVRQGNNKAALPLFDQALAKRNQLPPSLVTQIEREHRRAEQRLQSQP